MQGSTITAYIEVNAGQDRCGVEPGSDAAVELAQDIVYGNFAINSDYVLADFILFFSYVPAHARRVARWAYRPCLFWTLALSFLS